MSDPGTVDKFVEISQVSVEVLVNELKRRAVAKGMTTEELLKEAQTNWDDAEKSAEDLKNRQ